MAKDPVDQFADIRVGGVDPSSNEAIAVVIAKSMNYVVFLDAHNTVRYDHLEYPAEAPKRFNNAMARFGVLNSMHTSHLKNDRERAFREMLGKAVATLFDDPDESGPGTDILKEAEKYLRARYAEISRGWTLATAFTGMAIVILALGLVWAFRGPVEEGIGVRGFRCLAGAGIGSLGAFLSIFQRLGTGQLDPAAGRSLHILEGLARLSAGMIGALLLAFAIEAAFVGGDLISADRAFAFLLMVCLAAGASERLVPTFIETIESRVDGGEAEEASDTEES